MTNEQEFDLKSVITAPEIDLDDLIQVPSHVFATNSNRSELEAILKDWDKFEDNFARKADGGVKKAYAQMLLGEEEEAFELLKSCKSIPEAYYVLAEYHRRRGEFEEMAVVANDGAQRFTNYYILRLMEVEGDLYSRNIDEGKKNFKKLPKAVEGSAEYAYLEGLIAELEGEYDHAREKYDLAITRDPNHIRTMFRLAYQADLHGHDGRAIELYELIRIVLPCHVGAMMNLGTLYEDSMRWEEALECFESVLAQDPNNERARMFRDDVLASIESIVYEEDERKRDERQQVLKIPVTDFELSVRSRNCLNKMGIRSLGDLIMRSEQELLAYKNFGETSLNEIREMLASKGLRLGQALTDTKEGVSDDAKSEFLSRPIDTLQLSVRSRKVMDRLGIRLLGQLVEKSEAELLSERNFGQTSLEEIQKQLRLHGLSLAPPK
ncbi:MAG: tetratricopeptide repeat protein [Planctomycetota bacterium]|jgi:DNA-directed RNA polymerase subunit alpha